MYDGEIFSMFIAEHLVQTPDHLWSLCTVPKCWTIHSRQMAYIYSVQCLKIQTAEYYCLQSFDAV